MEEHLYLIRPLVLNVVHLNENVQGLGYDDLYQTALVFTEFISLRIVFFFPPDLKNDECGEGCRIDNQGSGGK